jgi:hypothetical protein
MLPSATLNGSAGSGRGAGPATTAPVAMLYWLPWHGQSMVPLLIVLTMHPMCVHTALNALNVSAVGWVTTTFCAGKILPPPTGIWAVAASAFAAAGLLAAGAALLAELVAALLAELALALALAAALGLALAAALGLLAAVGEAAVLARADALLDELAAPQAVTAPARLTSPTLARTPRLVASPSVCGSCVTTAPHRGWLLVVNRKSPPPAALRSSCQGERGTARGGSVHRLPWLRRAGDPNSYENPLKLSLAACPATPIAERDDDSG